jgi:hypothetical protein
MKKKNPQGGKQKKHQGGKTYIKKRFEITILFCTFVLHN